MDIIDVASSCMRRWYVFLTVVSVTIWIAYTQFNSVHTVYYANAVVGVAPANSQVQYASPGEAVPRNGLLDSGGPVLLVNMAVLAMNDSAVRSQVVAAGGMGNFVVRMFPTPPSAGGAQVPLPLAMIEATEGDATSASKTVDLAAATFGQSLIDIQKEAGVSDALLARALPVSPATAVAGIPSRAKTVIYTSIIGLTIAILGSALLDAALVWRADRSRRTAASRVGRRQQAGVTGGDE